MSTTDTATAQGLDVGEMPKLAPMLRRYLFVLGVAEQSIDDIVQEVFVVAMQKAFADRGREAAGALLRAVAKNLLLRSRRSAAARREVELAHEVWCEDGGDVGDDDRLDALRACVDGLPGRSRELLQGAYEQGLGRAELARCFGLRPDGVKTALRRLREALQTCVERKRGQR